MKTPEQYVHEACIKVNPSILNLVFGCEVRDMETDRTLVFIYLDDGVRIKACDPLNGYLTWIEDAQCQIIGRKIGIADIMLAIGYMSNRNERNKLEIGLNTDTFWIGNSISHNSMDWNLSQDDLSLQSEETKLFIAKLLGYETN